jgi:hypothetical protein
MKTVLQGKRRKGTNRSVEIKNNILVCVVASLTVLTSVRAADVDLNLTVVGQGYQTRTSAGDLLDRRRVTQWADLRAARLLGVDDLSLQISFRFDTELGLGDVFDDSRSSADLMLAQMSWRKVARPIDLVLGRQLILDELDFLFFDGLTAEVHLPAGLSLRLLGGFAVRDKSFLGGEELDLDGVEAGSIPAPVAGASLRFRHPQVWAGLDYRRVVLWDGQEPGWPVDDERMGASISLRLWKRTLGLDAGAAFNLLLDQWDRIRADVLYRLPRPLNPFRLEAGYLQSRPHFSMDSIFNFFSPAPFHEFHGGVRWDPGGILSVRLAYTHRQYQGGAGWDVNGVDLDSRVFLSGGRWILLTAGFEDGAVGRRWIAAPRIVWECLERTLLAEGRGVVSSFEDPVQENQHALTLGASGAITWRFSDEHALMIMAEMNGNRIHPFQFRFLGVLDLSFHFGSGGYR